jgi:hypothetical protein
VEGRRETRKRGEVEQEEEQEERRENEQRRVEGTNPILSHLSFLVEAR